jgi:hypothetical protein
VILVYRCKRRRRRLRRLHRYTRIQSRAIYLRSYTPLATKTSGHFFAWSLSLDSGDVHWTHSFIICHGGFNMPGVIHLTGN